MATTEDINNRFAQEASRASSTKDSYYDKDLKRSRYNIALHKYPMDLGSAELKHYIEFAINVRGKSKMVPESKRLFEISRDPNSANLTRDDLGGGTLRTVTAAAAGVGAGIATSAVTDTLTKGANSALSALSKTVAKKINITGAVSQKIQAGIATAAGAAAGGAILAADILKPDKTFRISDVIALYVDGPPSVKYSMQYANKDLGSLTALLAGSAFNTQGAFAGTGEAAAAFGAAMAKLPGAFGAADVGSALSASTGTALNPFKEVIFEAVDFRTFAFKYRFFPRSRSESDDVKRIIDLFKFHMHPELSTGKLFFIYPSEFQITYYFGSSENGYFHKFRPCVLQNMEVTYGGEQFSTFDDGHPTEVNVSLTFQETEILTRNMIGEAGNY